ncbi:class I adenylate-forming enzyme family protein [Arthrobacter sp. NPDC090010]|uniref:class I adenylate-forming enzyme family protein n=1 Tax=Arthrobacter sp. NPDC090010 TaxID=3363942 RepID=UPI003807DB25
MPFLTQLCRWAAERPHELAVAVGKESLSWAELRTSAEALLQGVPDGGYNVLRERNSVDFIRRWVAGISGTRRCAVLDSSLPEAQLRDVLRQLNRSWGAENPLALAEDHREGGRRGGDTVVVHHHRQDVAPALDDGAQDSLFLLALTSGTSSLPKAIIRTRASWAASFTASAEFFGVRPDDVTLAPGPLSSGLSLYALSECLYSGSAFRTVEQADVGEIHDAIEHDGVTRLVLVPALLRLLAERGIAAGADAGGLRSIVAAGAKLDPRTLEAARRWAPQATIFEYYGAQELSFVSGTRLDPQDPVDAQTLVSTSVGTPFPSVEIAVLDPDGEPLAEGVTGSIAVSSPMVSEGYLWGDDSQAFTRRGSWCTVHDQGYLSEGRLHFLGRASDMINTAGLNVYPQEVERALSALPGVELALVTGVPDPVRGQRLVAAVRMGHSGLGSGQLRMGLADLLDARKLPQEYYELREAPLTERGKPSRAMLRDWIAEGDPRTPRMRP